MRLQFGILWIEDNYSKAEEAALRSAAEISGFELHIENSRNGADIEHWAKEQEKYHLFDLVLLDLKLADGVMGDAIAPRARALFRSTPILFYSGSETDEQLRKRMAEDRVEGVFCAARENFTQRASEVIANLSLSLNRLSGMRGLAVEVVARVDDMCRELVLKFGQDGSHDKIVSDLSAAVLGQAKRTSEEFSKITTVDGQLQSRAVDSMKLFGVFREQFRNRVASLAEGAEKDQLRALSASTRDYRDEVIKVRNVLGHATEVAGDEGWQILDKDGHVFMTVRDFPTHRANFLRSLRAMREIHGLLIGDQT